MGVFGNLLGQAAGYGASKLFGGSDGVSDVAKSVGGSIGSLLPFKKGGKIKKVVVPGKLRHPKVPKVAKLVVPGRIKPRVTKKDVQHAKETVNRKHYRKGGTADGENAYAMGGMVTLPYRKFPTTMPVNLLLR